MGRTKCPGGRTCRSFQACREASGAASLSLSAASVPAHLSCQLRQASVTWNPALFLHCICTLAPHTRSLYLLS